MSILLTSFKRWHDAPIEGVKPYSIAVYQPHWYPALRESRWFDIREQGKWIRPRDFVPPNHDPTKPDMKIIRAYRNALMGLYLDRLPQIEHFLDHAGQNIALCCWCPYDKAAKRQLEDYGGFVCHSAVIDQLLSITGWDVERDADREKMVKF